MSQTLPKGWSIKVHGNNLHLHGPSGAGLALMPVPLPPVLDGTPAPRNVLAELREAMMPPIDWKAYGISVLYCEYADCGPALRVSCIVEGGRVSIEVPIGATDDALRVAEHVASGRPQVRVYGPSAPGGVLAITGAGITRVMTPERVRLAGVFCQIANDWMQQ